MSTYREQIESEILDLVHKWLDSAEEFYGQLPHFDIVGVVGAVSYTPDDEEPPADEAFSRDAVSYSFSDARQWAQVGVLRLALQSAESSTADDGDEE